MAAPHKLFLGSAGESADRTTVTLPLYRGTTTDPNLAGSSNTVWYVVTDASSKAWAKALDVNYAPRLAVAANTPAVEHVTWAPDGTLTFPATVNFAADRTFVPDPSWYGGSELGLPFGATPTAGAVGYAGYSPLVQLPDGTVLDASQVANATGHADKALSLDTSGPVGSVAYAETTGFFDHHTVHYISLDASVVPGAVLEDVTFAPALQSVPGGNPALENADTSTSARAGIIAFTNGQTGVANPERQGLGSTLVDAASIAGATGTNPPVAPPVPLNIIQAEPTAGPNSHYSPLWDVHLTRWDPAKTAYAQRTRQTSFEDVQALGAAGLVTQPDGTGSFAPTGRSAADPTVGGVVANCPIVSDDGPHGIDIQPLQ